MRGRLWLVPFELRRLAIFLELRRAPFGEYLPRFSQLYQLLPMIGVVHLRSHFSTFVGVRFVLGHLLHRSSPLARCSAHVGRRTRSS